MNAGMNWCMREAGLSIETANPQQARLLAQQPEEPGGPSLSLELLLEELDLHMFLQTASVAQRWKLRAGGPETATGAITRVAAPLAHLPTCPPARRFRSSGRRIRPLARTSCLQVDDRVPLYALHISL